MLVDSAAEAGQCFASARVCGGWEKQEVQVSESGDVKDYECHSGC